MDPAPSSASKTKLSDLVVLFALDLDQRDDARETLVALCERHGHQPFIIDAALDPVFAEHVKDPATRAHFPLLCVRGALVGGVDVITAMESNGKLAALFAPQYEGCVPTIALSQTAAEQFKVALTEPGACLRIVIGADFEHELAIDAPAPDDIRFNLGDIPCVLDPESAERADGLAIDWVESGQTKGFRIDNPNRPEPLHVVDRDWVDAQLASGAGPLVIDARTPSEYTEAHLPGARLLDAELVDALEQMDRREPLLFYCGNGVRSRKAAERCRENGFRTVYCLEGGLAHQAEAR